MINRDVLVDNGTWVAITVYGAVGLMLGVPALRKCGFAPFLRGLALGMMICSGALAALLVLEDTLLYTTF